MEGEKRRKEEKKREKIMKKRTLLNKGWEKRIESDIYGVRRSQEDKGGNRI